jgi:hypothetical protein
MIQLQLPLRDGRTTSATETSEETYFHIITIETSDGNETYKATPTLIR